MVSGSAPASADMLADPYLSQLLSYSLDTFKKEPQALQAQQSLLREELEETAVLHHKGFINAAKCFQEISGKVDDVHQQLHALATDMQDLRSQGESFITQAKSTQEKRRLNRSLLGLHATVIEFLEVPQLIDTCVRNGNHDEALDLMAFMSKMTLTNSKVPIVKQLVLELQSCSALLLEQLLGRLRSNVGLPECLRSVSYLRRLSVFSEADLRQKFLQCRETWFQSVLDGMDDSIAADYTRQLTDAHRLHVFDIVMQYRAIFSEAEPPALRTGGRGDAANSGATPQQSAARLLYSWAQHRVQLYVEALEAHLPRIQDGGSLTAAMESCMYCGRSLSRVGLDFRGLLVPIFAQCVLALYNQGINSAVASLAASLATHKWIHLPVEQRKSSARDAAASDVPPPTPSAADDQLAAAAPLLEHPPLAVFANGVIAALNSVRGGAMLRVSPGAAELTQGAVRQACAMLAHQPSTRALSEAEAPVHVDACRAMVDVACPLMLALFRAVFTSAAAQPDFSDAVVPLKALVQDAVDAAAPARAPIAQPSAAARSASLARTSSSHARASHGASPAAAAAAAAPPRPAAALPPSLPPPQARDAPARPPPEVATLTVAPEPAAPVANPAPLAATSGATFGGFAGSEEDESDADDNDAW